jgi:hypothetical protein
MPDATNQAFAQNQAQQLTVNFQNSSDPKLELQILNQMHSAGRQLGRISAVVDVLLGAVAGNNALATDAASTAVSQFRQMLAEIAEQKRAHSTDYFIAQLEALRREDLNAYNATAGRLRAFLDAPDPSAAPLLTGG